jgi:hypothetical protein
MAVVLTRAYTCLQSIDIDCSRKVAQLCIREEKIKDLSISYYTTATPHEVFHRGAQLSKASSRCLPEPIRALQSIDIDCSSRRWRSYALGKKIRPLSSCITLTYTARRTIVFLWCTGAESKHRVGATSPIRALQTDRLQQ